MSVRRVVGTVQWSLVSGSLVNRGLTGNTTGRWNLGRVVCTGASKPSIENLQHS